MVTLRPARQSDILSLVALLRQLFEIETQFAFDLDRHRAGIELILSRPELGRIIVAELDGGVIGMVNLQFAVSTAHGTLSVHIDDLVVDAAARGQGAGGALMEAAQVTAKELGAGRITVNVDPANASALDFYRRFGFSSLNLTRHAKVL